MNRAVLVGHVGTMPNINYSPNGIAVSSFTLATKSRNKGKPDDWHQIVAYGAIAEDAYKSIQVGQLVSIDGYVRTATYYHATDKSILVSKAEIVADLFAILKKSEKGQANGKQ